MGLDSKDITAHLRAKANVYMKHPLWSVAAVYKKCSAVLPHLSTIELMPAHL
jgi:hypothetical protein